MEFNMETRFHVKMLRPGSMLLTWTGQNVDALTWNFHVKKIHTFSMLRFQYVVFSLTWNFHVKPISAGRLNMEIRQPSSQVRSAPIPLLELLPFGIYIYFS